MERPDIELLTRIDTNVAALLAAKNDHEKRLRAVERKQWLHTGGLTLAGFVLAKMGVPWKF